jgi:hypothetical protein
MMKRSGSWLRERVGQKTADDFFDETWTQAADCGGNFM